MDDLERKFLERKEEMRQLAELSDQYHSAMIAERHGLRKRLVQKILEFPSQILALDRVFRSIFESRDPGNFQCDDCVDVGYQLDGEQLIRHLLFLEKYHVQRSGNYIYCLIRSIGRAKHPARTLLISMLAWNKFDKTLPVEYDGPLDALDDIRGEYCVEQLKRLAKHAIRKGIREYAELLLTGITSDDPTLRWH